MSAIDGLVTADSLTSRPISWLWKGRIPLKAIHMLDGDGGISKSTLTCMWASHVSRGAAWPDGSPCPQGRVLMYNNEDPAEEVQFPRLKAAGADISQVFVRDPRSVRAHFIIPDHVERLEQQVSDQNVKLIVFDPLLDYLSDRTSNVSEQQVRRAISFLTVFAHRNNCCVVLIRHMNKDSRQDFKHRGSGSVAFYALSRAGLIVVRDPTDKARMLMLANKLNWAKERDGIAYRVEDFSYSEDGETIETSRIKWDGLTAMTTDMIYRNQVMKEETGASPADAAQFIQEALSTGPVERGEVLRSATKEGFTKRDVHNAAIMMGVLKRSEGGKWFWELPAALPEGCIEPAKELL